MLAARRCLGDQPAAVGLRARQAEQHARVEQVFSFN